MRVSDRVRITSLQQPAYFPKKHEPDEIRGHPIEKIPKISASGQNFWTPSPLFKKGPYQRECQYFVPNSNYKVCFFQTSPILSIEVAPNHDYSRRNKNLTIFKNRMNTYRFKWI